MSYGFRGHCGLARETTWGTAVAATDYFHALSESIVHSIERFNVRNIIGGMYEPDDETGLTRNAGDIVLAAHPVSIGHMLYGVFGVNSITVVLSGVLFSNRFTPATTDANSLHPLPAYTLEIFRDVTSSQQYTGVNFNTIQLAVSPNQDLRLSAGIIAQGRNNIAATTPSYPGSPTGVFKFDTCSVGIGGAGINRVEALSFSFANQLEGVPALNASTNIARIKRTGSQTVRLGGTIAFEDQTQKQDFIAQTERQILVHFTRTASFALTIDIPRFVYTSFPDQITGRDRLTVDFEGMGRYHTGSAEACRLTLTTTNTFS